MSNDNDRQSPFGSRSPQAQSNRPQGSVPGSSQKTSIWDANPNRYAARKPDDYELSDETTLPFGDSEQAPDTDERAPRQYKTLLGHSKSAASQSPVSMRPDAAVRGGANHLPRTPTIAMTSKDLHKAATLRRTQERDFEAESEADYYDDKTLSLSPDELSAYREEIAQRSRRQPLPPQQSASYEDKTVAISLSDFPSDLDEVDTHDPSDKMPSSLSDSLGDDMRVTSNDDWIHAASKEPAPLPRRNDQGRTPARTMRFSHRTTASLPFFDDIGYALSARARYLRGESVDKAREKGGFTKLAMVGVGMAVLMLLAPIF